jgi:hypothetical protein
MIRNILMSPPLDSSPLGSKHHVQRAGVAIFDEEKIDKEVKFPA